MIKPLSIQRFDYCYLGAWALGLINTAINWTRYREMAQIRQAEATIGAWYLPVTIGVGMLIPLLLWFFISKRASVVAKWIMVVFAALGVGGALFALLVGSFAGGLAGVLTLASYALQVVAAWLLFRPDARAWFGEDYEEDAA